MALTLDQLSMKQLVFEGRYDNAYSLWDNAGQIWGEASKIWPDLRRRQSEPNATVFNSGRSLEFSCFIDRCVVVLYYDKSLVDAFPKIVSDFVDIVVAGLRLSAFSRLGYRTIYKRRYDSEPEATEIALSCNLIKVPEGTLFNVKGKPNHPEYALHWENDALGASVRLKVGKAKLNFDPQLDIAASDLKPLDAEWCELTWDVDQYTRAPLPVGQFKATEWISQCQRAFRRDSKIFLGG